MAINYFIGWSQSQLETELRAAQEDMAAGKQIVQSGAGDASMQNRIEKSVEQRIQLLLKSLNALDPDTYPISDVTAITTTRAVFY